jgi:hypothetical protein
MSERRERVLAHQSFVDASEAILASNASDALVSACVQVLIEMYAVGFCSYEHIEPELVVFRERAEEYVFTASVSVEIVANGPVFRVCVMYDETTKSSRFDITRPTAREVASFVREFRDASRVMSPSTRVSVS